MSFRFPRWGRKKKKSPSNENNGHSANKYPPPPHTSARTTSGADQYGMPPPAPVSTNGTWTNGRGPALQFSHPLYAMDEEGMIHLKATGKGLDETDIAVHQDEIINAVVKFVQDSMRRELGFEEVYLPSADAPVKANVFVSPNYQTCKKLLVFVAVSRGLYPGLWSRGLVLHAGVKSGSMLDYFRKALDEGYGIIVANPNKNVIVLRDGKQRIQIPGSASPEEHMDSLWDKYIANTQARRVYFLGYSYGGVLIKYLLQSRGDQLMRRNGAIALIESSHRIEDGDSQSVKSILAHRTMYWESNDDPFQSKLDGDAPHRTGCTCLSAGRPPRAHSNHYYVTAFCINRIRDALFRFLDTRDAAVYIENERPSPDPPQSAPAAMGTLERQNSRRDNKFNNQGSEKHCNLRYAVISSEFPRPRLCKLPRPSPQPVMSAPATDNVIHFGDVIKLHTKSAHQEGAAGGCIGLMKDKLGRQQLLVVPPVDGTEFLEGEFIIAPVRGDKVPSNNTPLNYKQPFVLRTSDGHGYSVNNKTPGYNDIISLQPVGIKGEMYVTIEKEGYTGDTNVHDGDMNVIINVVDSNRIRTKYNKPLTHFTKAKTNATGGFVCCGAKGTQLTFKVCKVPGVKETRKYIEDPVYRRTSMDAEDPIKSDEMTAPEVVDDDVVDQANDSKTSSAASLPSQPDAEGNQDGDTKNNEQGSTPLSPASDATTAASDQPETAAATETKDTAEPAKTASIKAGDVVVSVPEPAQKEATQTPSTLTTIPIDSTPVATTTTPATSTTTTTTPAAPVVDKLTANVPQEPSSATVASEDGETVEQVEMGCIGKCSIM
ncbi:TPA: hypothetical protein N0F65_004537 [Lagenidium giganteum]|uniref:Arb2 domain-containing protein n=1 Tax=Lagenidium giganteum TaxID=4803 RepID=A0AAV2YST1_9STRA|nr:TPA: hypothetical protein N0F65_004537 [Lagenidium giganteum]